jgi:hypothetical protein
MKFNKILSKILIIVGILGLVLAIVSMFFFQTTYGEIDFNRSDVSDVFHLKRGKKYSLNAIGTNWAFGFIDGELSLYTSQGSLISRWSVYFSFDGDSETTIIPLTHISVSVSGNYYLEFEDSGSGAYSNNIKISVQESLVQTIFGIDDFSLLFIGIIILLFGIIWNGLSGRISAFFGTKSEVMNQEAEPPQRYENDIESHSFESNDIVEITSEPEIKYGKHFCPLCGAKSDGNFCEECGTQLN